MLEYLIAETRRANANERSCRRHFVCLPEEDTVAVKIDAVTVSAPLPTQLIFPSVARAYAMRSVLYLSLITNIEFGGLIKAVFIIEHTEGYVFIGRMRIIRLLVTLVHRVRVVGVVERNDLKPEP